MSSIFNFTNRLTKRFLDKNLLRHSPLTDLTPPVGRNMIADTYALRFMEVEVFIANHTRVKMSENDTAMCVHDVHFHGFFDGFKLLKGVAYPYIGPNWIAIQLDEESLLKLTPWSRKKTLMLETTQLCVSWSLVSANKIKDSELT